MARVSVIFALIFGSICVNAEQVKINFKKEQNDAIIKAILPCVPEGKDIREYLTLLEQGTVLEEDSFKQFVYCGFKESGFSNEDGTIKAKHAADAFPDPDLVYKTIIECDKMRGSTPVDTTFNYLKCFLKESPYLFSLTV